MAKLTTSPISAFTQSAITTINQNMDDIEAAVENTLSRDGTTPNQMLADFDMNDNDILNVDNLDANVIVLGGEVLIPGDVSSDTIEGIADALDAIGRGGKGGVDYALNYTGALGLTTASLQSPLTTNAAFYMHGTTTSLNQNFLAQYELISNTVSNNLGGAVALDAHVEATANSGGVWAGAFTVQLDTGWDFTTHSSFIQEFGVNNLAGEFSDLATGNSLGISLNGLGYRNTAAIYVNNMQQYIVTTSATAAGNAVLTFAGGVPAWFKIGGVITNLTNPGVIPAGTTIQSKTATTITLTANVTGAGVAIGDRIQTAQPLWYQGIKFAQYGIAQYAINDQSNSAISYNLGGTHQIGIDFSSATTSSAAIRMGVGISQGITARFSGTDYLMMYADASGHAVFGNSTLGNMFADSNWVPQVASTYNLGSTSARWASVNGVNADFSGTMGIGITPSATTRLLVGGTVTNGAGNSLGLNVTPILAPASGAAAVFAQAGGAVATGGNTIAGAYAAYLAAPTKSGGGTITTAYSAFLEAPSSGTTNYSLYAAGSSRFQTDVKVDGYISTTARVIKTNDFTVAANETWLICNKGSTLTVTLPAAASFTGRELTIKTIQAFTVVSASSNVVPLAGGAAGTAILAATAGKWATLVSDGSAWYIMAGN